MDNFDTLLNDSASQGTFHDAALIKVQQRDDRIELHFSLCVGDPDSPDLDERERRRSGMLILRGVHQWKCDPRDATLANVGTWLTADGPLTELDSKVAEPLANNAPPNLVQHYFYFSDTNAFLPVACDKLEFCWC